MNEQYKIVANTITTFTSSLSIQYEYTMSQLYIWHWACYLTIQFASLSPYLNKQYEHCDFVTLLFLKSDFLNAFIPNANLISEMTSGNSYKLENMYDDTFYDKWFPNYEFDVFKMWLQAAAILWQKGVILNFRQVLRHNWEAYCIM